MASQCNSGLIVQYQWRRGVGMDALGQWGMGISYSSTSTNGQYLQYNGSSAIAPPVHIGRASYLIVGLEVSIGLFKLTNKFVEVALITPIMRLSSVTPPPAFTQATGLCSFMGLVADWDPEFDIVLEEIKLGDIGIGRYWLGFRVRVGSIMPWSKELVVLVVGSEQRLVVREWDTDELSIGSMGDVLQRILVLGESNWDPYGYGIQMPNCAWDRFAGIVDLYGELLVDCVGTFVAPECIAISYNLCGYMWPTTPHPTPLSIPPGLDGPLIGGILASLRITVQNSHGLVLWDPGTHFSTTGLLDLVGPPHYHWDRNTVYNHPDTCLKYYSIRMGGFPPTAALGVYGPWGDTYIIWPPMDTGDLLGPSCLPT
ncbi:hypothetical protein G9A89_000339 [Geosiphon pyriformis]|nr:hypothetical protein G9A89_000339 [Geosiphon pyriformis]